MSFTSGARWLANEDLSLTILSPIEFQLLYRRLTAILELYWIHELHSLLITGHVRLRRLMLLHRRSRLMKLDNLRLIAQSIENGGTLLLLLLLVTIAGTSASITISACLVKIQRHDRGLREGSENGLLEPTARHLPRRRLLQSIYHRIDQV